MANGKTAPVTDADSGHIMSISFHSTFTTDASPSIPGWPRSITVLTRRFRTNNGVYRLLPCNLSKNCAIQLYGVFQPGNGETLWS
jgi:hypothetical protein